MTKFGIFPKINQSTEMLIDLMKILVSGPEAKDFLQGLVTCDMRLVKETPSRGALCNTQGRVISSFEIQQAPQCLDSSNSLGSYEIMLPASMTELTLKSLSKYARFSNVSLDSFSCENTLNLIHCIQQETAVILPETSEKFTPHELNYPQLGFVSFDKGCYKGQEIIARMQYLGKLKKHLKHLVFSEEKNFNQFIEKNNKDTLVNAAKNPDTQAWEALCILPILTTEQTLS